LSVKWFVRENVWLPKAVTATGIPGSGAGVNTLWAQDTADPRHYCQCLTDTSAPTKTLKTLQHWATLDQAMEPCILVVHELFFTK